MALNNIIELDIAKVKVKKRVREKNEDLELLTESIKKYGLLEPIIVDEKYRLIAGMRRLTACKNLGFNTILANVIKVEDDEMRLLLEMEENICRLQFSEREISKAQNLLYKIRHPNFFVWLWNKIKSFFIRK